MGQGTSQHMAGKKVENGKPRAHHPRPRATGVESERMFGKNVVKKLPGAGKMHKSRIGIGIVFVQYSILHFRDMYGIILVSRGGEPTQVGSGCADKDSAMDEPLLSKL